MGQTAVAAFKDLPYDVMDVSAKQFDDDFYEFRCRIKVLPPLHAAETRA